MVKLYLKKSTKSIIKICMEYLFSPSRFRLLLLLTFYVMFDHCLIQIYKIISHVLNFFSDQSNHNKVYDFYKNILSKTNGQTYV
jgi:hypothetical protein